MRYIYLLLFLLACAEDSGLQKQDCELMIISDSLPFKFWQDGKSFNTRQICGVNPQCYCAPWICDREIRLQVKDTIDGQDVNLLIVDESETVLKTLPFSQTEVTGQISPALQFSNTDFPGNITGWNSFNGSDRSLGSQNGSWSYSAGDAVTNNSSYRTKYFATQNPDNVLGWPAGEYTISIRMIGFSQNGPFTAKVFGMPNSSSQTEISSSVTGTISVNGVDEVQISISFTTTQYWSYLAFTFDSVLDVGDVSVTLKEISIQSTLVYKRTIYDLAFTPSEISPEICNKKVYFKIVGDTEEYLTDCIDIRDSFPEKCLKEIIYSNSKDFDNISYEDISPDPQFRKIVEAQFWKEDNPQEQEDSVLSNGVIVTRRSEIQEKTLFETGFLPNHEHKNLQKIFMHNYVVIEDVTGEEIQWKKRDAYETENLNRYPLKRAQIWLTKYNSVEKNTI